MLLFRFSGRLAPKPYFRAAAWRVGFFIASVFAFPFLLKALVLVYGCHGEGGGCGPFALIAGTAYKPTVFVLFVGSLVGISLCRARDAGLPAFTGLFIPLMFFADYTFGVFAAAPWSFAFSSGVLRQVPPFYFAFGLICIVLLGLAPTAPLWTRESLRKTHLDTQAIAVLAALIAFTAAWKLSTAQPGMTLWLRSVPGSTLAWRLFGLSPNLMLGFVGVAVFAIVRTRRAGPEPIIGDEAAEEQTLSSQERLAVIGILCAGVVLTLAAATFDLGGKLWSGLLPFAMFFVPMLLPTFILYTLPLWAVWRALARPSVLALVLVVLTLVPFALWGQSYSAAKRQFENPPSFPPLLNVNGWVHRPNIIRPGPTP